MGAVVTGSIYQCTNLRFYHPSQPAILTKDLCVIIYGRDSRTLPLLSHAGLSTRVLKHLLTGSYRNAESNHVMAIFELVLRRSLEAGSPGVARRQRRVLDTSTMYVRGQENLGGWQPRGDSLIFDHQWELEKLTRLEMVERTRHRLLTSVAEDDDEVDAFYDLPAANHFQVMVLKQREMEHCLFKQNFTFFRLDRVA